MWPFKKKPVDVPPVPYDVREIILYNAETADLIDQQRKIIGNPFKWREFNRNHRVITARQDATHRRLDEMGIPVD